MTIEIPKTIIIIVENLGPFIGLGYRLFGAKAHKDTCLQATLQAFGALFPMLARAHSMAELPDQDWAFI